MQAQGGPLEFLGEERRTRHKGHALLNRLLGQHIRVGQLAALARQLDPQEQATLRLGERHRISQLGTQRMHHGVGPRGIHLAHSASVAGICPASRYCVAVAWPANVLVCASLNCLHITALASSSALAISQPMRNRGLSTLDSEPQCAS